MAQQWLSCPFMGANNGGESISSSRYSLGAILNIPTLQHKIETINTSQSGNLSVFSIR